MKPYTHYKGEYSQEDSLQIDEDKLSDAKLKLTRSLNPFAREFYEEEVIKCEELIKERTAYILSIEEWKK